MCVDVHHWLDPPHVLAVGASPTGADWAAQSEVSVWAAQSSVTWKAGAGAAMGAADVPGKLEHGPLGVGTAGHNKHISWVFHRGNGSGSQNHLLPGLLQIDDVDPIGFLLEDVLLHCSLAVVRPDVG